MNALHKANSCWSRYSQVIEDIQVRLNRFQFYSVQHTHKEANEVAHCLVLITLSRSLNQILMEDSPNFIHSSLVESKIFSPNFQCKFVVSLK